MDHQENKVVIQLQAIKSSWTRHDRILFVNAYVNVPEDIDGRWQKIADAIPGKSAEEAKAHYEETERELREIECASSVEFPRYIDDNDDRGCGGCGGSSGGDGEESCVKVKKGDESVVSSNSELGTSQKSSESKLVKKERKKGTPWTVEEHSRLILFCIFKWCKFDFDFAYLQFLEFNPLNGYLSWEIDHLDSEILGGAEGLWKRRLAQHFKKVGGYKDCHTGRQSCPEVFHSAEFRYEKEEEVKHS
ncbi:hypothetical protein E3N88_03060 [Mikania micrantha]|uniref:SANT domain-containing protein n=1 Tax=Mikania micrantha TaxID=192012 RepID=A0A5N6Q5G8_9ASTR|nr:hypothetical protein E3N88_03024 [Mikania micrantha]KAD7479924.1 hypothetical protein E3N88_03060 [Mikania micrantha]